MNLVTKADHTYWHAAPSIALPDRDGIVTLLDPEAPNWIATDTRGARILSYMDGHTSFEEAAARYARDFAVDAAKAWHHVDYFVREAARSGFVGREPFAREPYAGRAH